MGANPKGPLTDAELDQLRQLHTDGASRNDIARALDRSGSTISKACARLGLSFDRTKVAAATAAKVADAKALRAEIALGLLNDAQRLQRQLFAPAKVYNIGGKDNVYTERQVDEPPFRDKRDIMQSVATAVNASLRLDEYDRGTDVDDAKSMIENLFDGLTGAWNQYHRDHPEQTPGGPG